jgi:Na+-transporting methylmalonyl-CoA/oxaloacetate decarboxylase gamma subunit
VSTGLAAVVVGVGMAVVVLAILIPVIRLRGYATPEPV